MRSLTSLIITFMFLTINAQENKSSLRLDSVVEYITNTHTKTIDVYYYDNANDMVHVENYFDEGKGRYYVGNKVLKFNNDKLISEAWYGNKEQKSEEFTIEYDKEGKIIKRMVRSWLSDDDHTDWQYIYKYDGQKIVLEEEYFGEIIQPVTIKRYNYNDSGLLTSIVKSRDNIDMFWETYHYNDDHKLIKYTCHDKNRHDHLYNYSKDYEYDSEGKISSILINERGVPRYKYDYIYDAQGNVVHIDQFQIDKSTNKQSYFLSYIYCYDLDWDMQSVVNGSTLVVENTSANTPCFPHKCQLMKNVITFEAVVGGDDRKKYYYYSEDSHLQ